jgi:SDR family mycofactocin-dependent oxidoreductase
MSSQSVSSQQLAGKVAFITGVARGQGRAHALRLAAAGADIVGIDICAQIDGVEYPMATPDDLAETVKLVEETGRRIVVGEADVRDVNSMDAVYRSGLDAFGRLDFVIANAGIMPIFGERSRERAAWDLCLDVMLTGVLNTVELTYRQIVEKGDGGSIVITSSMAALLPMMRTEYRHTFGMLGYSAAKAALVNLARNYASILAVHRIRVNTVHPTGVDTPMINNSLVTDSYDTIPAEDMNLSANAIPIRAVDADDIAAAVLWLCSDDSRFYTGNAMRVDAGASLR